VHLDPTFVMRVSFVPAVKTSRVTAFVLAATKGH